MIPIKIECGCGQRYAFDVEPVEGRMPAPIFCPACSADGTHYANTVIAQSLPAPEPMAAMASAGPAIQVRAVAAAAVVSAPAPKQPVRRPGQLSREQAEHEARAKILWGDEPASVEQFLMMHGVSRDEAVQVVKGLFEERAATIRSNGAKKSIKGVACICVPIVAVVIFLAKGSFPAKIFGLSIMVGCYGLWLLISGLIMFFSPRSESGDASA